MTERLPAPDTTRFPPLRKEFVRVLTAGTLMGRIHFTNGPFPSAWNTFRSFGPTTNRFDHHPPPRGIHPVRAILYGAPLVPGADGKPLEPLDTCLVEVFRDTGVVDVATNNPYFALFRLTRNLRLLDLVDSRWITMAGGNAAISSGRRSQAREWARAIYRHYGADEAPDGLFYSCSNMPTGRSVALFERARDAVPQHPALDLPIAHPGLWADVEYACTALGLDLVS